MKEEKPKETLPCSCGNCICATCYEQEFCDRCSSCKELSHKKDACGRYEGAYCY